MISSRPHFYLLNMTLQAQNAHAIHTGHGDTTHDSLVVRDANGLPTLPGTSMAGVLRHQYQNLYGKQQAQDLFGFAQGSAGQTSWLNVSWGLVHNSQNQAQEGLLNTAQLQDPLLEQLLNQKPIVRQRVRLTDKGVTDGTGKFDTTLIPAGVRYSTCVSYWCDGSQASQTQWQNFIDLLKNYPLRIGQGARNGYGLFNIIDLYQGHWDLRTVEGRQNYSQRPRHRSNHQGLEKLALSSTHSMVQATLNLQAESNWRIGGGEQYLEALQDGQRIPDLLPMHETKVTWQGSKASIGEQFYLLTASAIKGALRHRVAFHYNCLTGHFVDDDSAFETDENPAINKLFGFAKDKDGKAGVLAFHDIYLQQQQIQVDMHNKIDRYTGGVITGALFSEAVLWQSQVQIKIDILKPTAQIDKNAKQALALALQDLADGWLPLGASGSRGLGVFQNNGQGVVWSDAEQWMNAGEMA
ncbi:RAMP superfamily CRISPR-associated protein [Acinetobacter sp. NIPH 1869]|uniref:RAMP superfamily CRISPR-associated protein n=1 Tax=Acinetobacter higginsii TaxID=70347 RepID=UPI001F4A4001|nr:RAMP superfamily CRISPR-associated protein [Acinetobacter higginsii]MCH7306287.1 RAMP superfamily CRISPR-associated protein [Acinetobacter higginsii]